MVGKFMTTNHSLREPGMKSGLQSPCPVRWVAEIGSSFSVMRIHTFIFALALIATGCDGRDAKLHHQIVGTWTVEPSGSITFFPDGSFHFTNSFLINSNLLAFSSDGAWSVRDGFMITTTTNSMAFGTDENPPVGKISRRKINFIDEHNLCYGDEHDGAAYHR